MLGVARPSPGRDHGERLVQQFITRRRPIRNDDRLPVEGEPVAQGQVGEQCPGEDERQ